MGEKVVSVETNDKNVQYSLDLGFKEFGFSFGYGQENTYFKLHRKHIPIKEYKNSTEKDEYQNFL